jgi:hypothetical protein
MSIGERKRCRYANGLGILELDGKRYALKNRKKERNLQPLSRNFSYTIPLFDFAVALCIIQNELFFISNLILILRKPF